MSKTALTVGTACGLALLSLGLILSRWHVLGAEIDGTPGNAVWKVELEVDGALTAPDSSVTMYLPPDFRRQHIVDEAFASRELSHKVKAAKDGSTRKAVWSRPISAGQRQPFRLVYSFRAICGMHRPTLGMIQRTRVLDAAPATERHTKPGPLVESEVSDVVALAERLVKQDQDPERAARALYEHVARFSAGEEASAVDCLRAGSGSAAGKARLLIALCRSQKVRARIVVGLVLQGDGLQPLHHWAEAWVGDHWLPMDPAGLRFGAAQFADDYVVLHLGDDPIRAERAHFAANAVLTDLHNSLAPGGGAPPSWGQRIWRKMSLANLRPEEQTWVKFLLLLPVGALAVAFFRTVIGITTFGTFGPALLGLVCRDPKDFPWALGIFVGIMLTGWGVRRLLDYYHLLMVPRIAVLLTAIVILLLVGTILLGPYSVGAGGYVALLPLIIMTHMVERFWTIEAEDGTAASFKTLLGTVAVAAVVALLVSVDIPVNGAMRWMKYEPILPADVVRTVLFRFPETLGLVLAAQLLLGRYTGYRLTELFRFQDLLVEETPLPPPAEGKTGQTRLHAVTLRGEARAQGRNA